MNNQTRSLVVIILTAFAMLYLFLRDMNKMSLLDQPAMFSVHQIEESAVVDKISDSSRQSVASTLTIQAKIDAKRYPSESSDSNQENQACMMVDDIVTCLVEIGRSSSCLFESDSFNLNELYSQSEIYPDKKKYESIQSISDSLLRSESIAQEEEYDEHKFLLERSAVICVTFRDQCIEYERTRLVRFGDHEFHSLLNVFTPAELTEYVQLRSQQESQFGCQRVYIGGDDPETIYEAIEEQDQIRIRNQNPTGGAL